MTWRPDGPQGNEAAKIKHLIVPYTRGRVLDLGCGPHKAWPHFIGVDNGHHAREFGWEYKPDIHVEDCARLDLFRSEGVDAVFSSHLLEHIEDYRGALKEWWSVIRFGGHLVLYLPHKDYYPNIGQPGASPDHKHDFTPRDIISAMREIEPYWGLVLCENRDEGDEYSFLMVFQKRQPQDARHPDILPLGYRSLRAKKTALVCRFGGFGDLLMASSVLPGLKRQGYHVTFMTTPRGRDLLAEDPHVDSWWVQDENQVENSELPAYWEAVGSRFDRFVNLSESVEGTLLAVPGRANHGWPDEVRRARLGKVNYLDFIHELAGVPHGPALRFYPTEAERAWATEFRAELGADSFVIVWSLAGSSLHKAYPWTDNVVARLMIECPGAKVVFVGDTACQILEQGWEEEPRVVRRSGVWSMRESLAFLEVADCVVGPETGVLNAAGALETVAKVIMLSHSSHENLTRDWKNTTVLTVEGLPCHPCHRLHFGDRYCHVEPESHAALCAFAIEPDRVFEAIRGYYDDACGRVAAFIAATQAAALSAVSAVEAMKEETT
jgi:ADP-heptose:LPS heptosyltransferase/predicted SAM-dependent methyltransferase